MRSAQPVVHRRAGLPDKVTIWEVGARDGLQNEPVVVPTAVKAELIARLIAAGLTTVEATSFVAPRWVPQLADAQELYAMLERPPGVRLPVLVPNQVGLARALACGVTDICVFASATESFARRNLNCSMAESMAMFVPVVAEARSHDVAVRGYVSMCFGDPWEGHVPAAQVVGVTEALLAMGCAQVSLGDTIGVATTGQVTDLLGAHRDRGIGVEHLAVHFHDTYGQALANTLCAVECGVTTLDASAGGLGGCPFAGSATGNLATEDLCWALHGLGIETGVDLDRLVEVSQWMAEQLGRPSPSRVVQAMARRAAPVSSSPREPVTDHPATDVPSETAGRRRGQRAGGDSTSPPAAT